MRDFVVFWVDEVGPGADPDGTCWDRGSLKVEGLGRFLDRPEVGPERIPTGHAGAGGGPQSRGTWPSSGPSSGRSGIRPVSGEVGPVLEPDM